MTKAVLKLHIKKMIANNVVLEMKMWEVQITSKYPNGIKYRLVIVDQNSDKKVLMDNHSPKGHHYHLNNKEFDYSYSGVPQLVNDFKSLVKIHMGVTL